MRPFIARTGLGPVLTFAAAFLIALVVVNSAHAASLTRAFTDDVYGDVASPVWVNRTVQSGAKMVLLERSWGDLETSRGHFYWGDTDALVRRFEGTGVQVALLISGAPSWAEAPGGPAAFESDGAWKPNVSAFGQLAKAVAQHYSGSTPDPLRPGQMLPRVRYYQAWAEANLSIHLAPQWSRVGGQWVNSGADMYRSLLNAFYSGVKSAHSDNQVITTGFGPYGDPSPGTCKHPAIGVGAGCRVEPLLFLRQMLCLNAQDNPLPCSNPAEFDDYAIDPYEVGSPTTKAGVANDISLPDLHKLTTVVKKAQHSGRAPGGPKHLWVTEFSYESRPPNPYAVSLARQARWLEQSFYIMWKQGVQVAVWYLLRDQAAKYNPNAYFSGIYWYGGKAKPAAEAYRFPFVVSGGTIWGISPRTGTLKIEHKRGGRWSTLAKIHGTSGAVFTHRVRKSLRGKFRGVVGPESSLVWSR
jgi:hypothetical protein